MDMAQSIKWVRERNGLSQRELASRAGVTNSNISMIEQGAVSPTVNSLTRLLDVIPLSLAQFFACDPERDSGAIYRAGELRSLRRSEEHTSELQSRGHLVCRLLLEKKK